MNHTTKDTGVDFGVGFHSKAVDKISPLSPGSLSSLSLFLRPRRARGGEGRRRWECLHVGNLALYSLLDPLDILYQKFPLKRHG